MSNPVQQTRNDDITINEEISANLSLSLVVNMASIADIQFPSLAPLIAPLISATLTESVFSPVIIPPSLDASIISASKATVPASYNTIEPIKINTGLSQEIINMIKASQPSPSESLLFGNKMMMKALEANTSPLSEPSSMSKD